MTTTSGGDHTRAYGREDMVCVATAIKVPSVGGPSWAQVGTSGIYTWSFAKGETAYLTYQMSHGYHEGTNVYFHLHWSPDDAGAGVVNWEADFQAASIDGAFSGAASTSSGRGLNDATTSTAYVHHVTPEVTVTGTGLTVSHIFAATLTRIDDGTDTYAGEALFWSADVHYAKAKRGDPWTY